VRSGKIPESFERIDPLEERLVDGSRSALPNSDQG
jgi:hypothetical protein